MICLALYLITFLRIKTGRYGKNEGSSIAIYVASTYGAKNGLWIKGESNRSFVISCKDQMCTGQYSRKGNKLDFVFETNEVFDFLEHIEFNC